MVLNSVQEKSLPATNRFLFHCSKFLLEQITIHVKRHGPSFIIVFSIFCSFFIMYLILKFVISGFGYIELLCIANKLR